MVARGMDRVVPRPRRLLSGRLLSGRPAARVHAARRSQAPERAISDVRPRTPAPTEALRPPSGSESRMSQDCCSGSAEFLPCCMDSCFRCGSELRRESGWQNWPAEAWRGECWGMEMRHDSAKNQGLCLLVRQILPSQPELQITVHAFGHIGETDSAIALFVPHYFSLHFES